MRRRLPVLMAAMVLMGGLSSCGTIESLVQPHEPKIFGGTRIDVSRLEDTNHGIWVGCVPLIDLPMSLGLDAALLPMTIIWEIVRASAPPEKPPAESDSPR
jgi:uncharacterized protein YceK